MKRIFIFGSCVSRDMVEFGKNEFELVEYFSRSSFSSLASLPVSFEMNLLESIKSDFQRKMVERDLNKSIFNQLKLKETEYYLIGLIDERFSLFKDKNKSIGTISNELGKVLPTVMEIRHIKNTSEEYFELFELGFIKFINEIDDLTKLKVINAKWATLNENGEELRFSPEVIMKENERLNRLFSIVKKHIPEDCFINLPEKLFIADSSHKWGEEPFHYTKPFYEYIICALT